MGAGAKAVVKDLVRRHVTKVARMTSNALALIKIKRRMIDKGYSVLNDVRRKKRLSYEMEATDDLSPGADTFVIIISVSVDVNEVNLKHGV
ncbi:hypothetical protein Bca52824_069378 [Brassica carinata]|uniref:Uncharacterized protein n=1 Tax=Brassica carinata TaxID=52824 RepID=A0A8X7Q758_BRACI|nr:hypothetical protein Bca52824_069378 [Brassica carinata]